MRYRTVPPRSPSPPPPNKKQKLYDSFADRGVEDEADEESDEDMGFGLFDGDSPPQTPIVEKKVNIDEDTLLQRLIKRQTFEGSWTNDNLPCDSMGIVRHSASVVIEKLVAAHPELDREKIGVAVATTIAVTFLEKKMADQEDTWELVVEKAREWLDGAGLADGILKTIWKEVESLIT